MEEKTKVIPKESIFTVTSGEYSDYYTLTVCKALVDIDVKVMQDEYFSEHPSQKKEYSLEESSVVSWMVNKKGYAEEIDFSELHLGEYHTADFIIT